ncbi:hypothetical protein B0H34DRAFT_56646 [Crassisporium funariophilum]|nr:hypothetical protein B0H34DRAFT_56646 [Crassisporium funariophilum]
MSGDTLLVKEKKSKKSHSKQEVVVSADAPAAIDEAIVEDAELDGSTKPDKKRKKKKSKKPEDDVEAAVIAEQMVVDSKEPQEEQPEKKKKKKSKHVEEGEPMSVDQEGAPTNIVRKNSRLNPSRSRCCTAGRRERKEKEETQARGRGRNTHRRRFRI